MNYQEAITAIKNGSTVRRTSWSNRSVKQTTDANGGVHITVTHTTTVSSDYLATQEDMFANDWTT